MKKTLPLILLFIFLIACSAEEQYTPIFDADSIVDDDLSDNSDNEMQDDLSDDSTLPDEDNNQEIPDDTPQPNGSKCTSFNGCNIDEVCDFSRGICEFRQTEKYALGEALIFNVKSNKVAPGDMIIVDGISFFNGNEFGPFASVSIGGTPISGDWAGDRYLVVGRENRILVEVPEGLTGGPVAVNYAGKNPVSIENIEIVADDTIECESDDPVASGVVSKTIGDGGPFAAGYLDVRTKMRGRVYYPAECGGNRRPVKAGDYPIAFILSGKNPYLNQEYLGQYLATWGFIAVSLEVDYDFHDEYQSTGGGVGDTMYWDPKNSNSAADSSYSAVRSFIESIRGKNLAILHPVLSGVVASEKIAMIATGDAAEVASWTLIDFCGMPTYDGYGSADCTPSNMDDNILSASGENTVASILVSAISPASDPYTKMPMPGHFLTIGGSLNFFIRPETIHAQYDRQHSNVAGKDFTNMAWSDRIFKPAYKVLVNGATSDVFSDNQLMLGLIGDYEKVCNIKRNKVLKIISSYTLPVLERAFKEAGVIDEEHFPSTLDDPWMSPEFVVESK